MNQYCLVCIHILACRSTRELKGVLIFEVVGDILKCDNVDYSNDSY